MSEPKSVLTELSAEQVERIMEPEVQRNKEMEKLRTELLESQAREIKLREALAVAAPCIECGEPGVVQYDSQGESRYWLCIRTAGVHGPSYYSGVETYRIATPKPPLLGVLEKVRDLFQELTDNCQASLAETDISDDRKSYRLKLFTRANEALTLLDRAMGKGEA